MQFMRKRQFFPENENWVAIFFQLKVIPIGRSQREELNSDWSSALLARLRFNFVTAHCVKNLCFILKRSFHQPSWPFSAAAASFSFAPVTLSRETLQFSPYREATEFHTAPHPPLPPPPLWKSLDKPLLISRSVPCHCRGPVHNLFLDVFCPTLSGVRKHGAACSDICYHLMPSKLLISIKEWGEKISSGLIKQLQSLCLQANCTVSFA